MLPLRVGGGLSLYQLQEQILTVQNATIDGRWELSLYQLSEQIVTVQNATIEGRWGLSLYQL